MLTILYGFGGKAARTILHHPFLQASKQLNVLEKEPSACISCCYLHQALNLDHTFDHTLGHTLCHTLEHSLGHVLEHSPNLREDEGLGAAAVEAQDEADGLEELVDAGPKLVLLHPTGWPVSTGSSDCTMNLKRYSRACAKKTGAAISYKVQFRSGIQEHTGLAIHNLYLRGLKVQGL